MKQVSAPLILALALIADVPPVSAQAPQMRTPAKLFADGLERYKAGKLEEAADFFKAGLAQNPTDVKAWEILARVQLGLNKVSEAKKSLQEAVKLGLADGAASAIARELAYEKPAELAHEFQSCFSTDAQEVLRSLRIPTAAKGYTTSYVFHHLYNRNARWSITVTPVAGGYAEHSTMDDRRIRVRAIALGGMVSCDDQVRILALRITGSIFPLRAGQQFLIESTWEYSFENPKKRHDHVSSCEIGQSGPAKTIRQSPSLPNRGTLTPVHCKSRFGSDNYESTQYYSDEYGLFFGGGDNSATSPHSISEFKASYATE